MGSLLLIKDKTEVHKEETNGMYLHEDAAYNYLTSKYEKTDKNILSSIELAIKGYIVVSLSPSYILMVLPDELNDDQKEYLERKKSYLSNNLNKLSIVNIINDNDKYIQEEYIGEKLYTEFDELINKKLNKGIKILKKHLDD